MASGNETATFGINLDGNAKEAALAAAAAMDQMRQRIAASTASLKEMQAAQRALKGDTAELTKARDDLKARIAAEKAALSAATVEALKAGTSYEKLTEAAKREAKQREELAKKIEDEKKEREELAKKNKDNAEEKATNRLKAMHAAISAGGGPVASLRDKLKNLKEVMGENGAGGAASILTLGLAGLAAAVVAVTAAVAGGVAALGKWIVKGADAARSAGLLREAAMGGNAQWGKNFGEQVDALARNVPTSKAEIDKLGISLAKSRIGGQVWVDTLNAVTQASAALGDDAGSKIKEFVERGRMMNRLQINPQEMIGTGVDFQDVAKALADSMHVGVKEAQAALFEGRVKLGDGAKALRDAVEKKFGSINLRQAMSLDNLAKKLGESFDALTKGVNIEPILKSFKELASVFDVNTVSGQALKQIIEVFGKELGVTITGATPIAKKFIYGLIIGAQELVISYLQVRQTLRSVFGDAKTHESLAKLNIGLRLGQATMSVLAFGALQVGVAFTAITSSVEGLSTLFGNALDAAKSFNDGVRGFFSGGWEAIGSQIVDGLITGITKGASRMGDAVKGLGEGVKNAFTDVLKIHSPSKVFEEYGKHTTEGYAQGVEQSSDRADSAAKEMVKAPSGGGAAEGGGAPSIVVNINASGSNAKEVAAAVSDASVLEQITKAIIDGAHGAGIGVPA